MSFWRHIVQRLQLTRPRLAVRKASLRTTAPVYRITDEGRVSLGSDMQYRRLGAWLVGVAIVGGAALLIVYL